MPAASTTISTPPKRFTAASTILSQFTAELGRRLIASTLAPSFSQSAVTFFSASVPPGREHEVAAGAGEHLRGQRAERPGRAGDDGSLAAHIEQGQRIFQEVFG